jgi:hypothetical protein
VGLAVIPSYLVLVLQLSQALVEAAAGRITVQTALLPQVVDRAVVAHPQKMERPVQLVLELRAKVLRAELQPIVAVRAHTPAAAAVVGLAPWARLNLLSMAGRAALAPHPQLPGRP